MSTSTSNADLAQAGAVDVLIPLIRAAATIGFVIAPSSLGFVIIAVSEQLIHSIMVGDDPEILVSDLQNQFPDAAMEVIENYDAGLVAKVVDLIERSDQALDLPLDIRGTEFGGVIEPRARARRTACPLGLPQDCGRDYEPTPENPLPSRHPNSRRRALADLQPTPETRP